MSRRAARSAGADRLARVLGAGLAAPALADLMRGCSIGPSASKRDQADGGLEDVARDERVAQRTEGETRSDFEPNGNRIPDDESTVETRWHFPLARVGVRAEGGVEVSINELTGPANAKRRIDGSDGKLMQFICTKSTGLSVKRTTEAARLLTRVEIGLFSSTRGGDAYNDGFKTRFEDRGWTGSIAFRKVDSAGGSSSSSSKPRFSLRTHQDMESESILTVKKFEADNTAKWPHFYFGHTGGPQGGAPLPGLAPSKKFFIGVRAWGEGVDPVYVSTEEFFLYGRQQDTSARDKVYVDQSVQKLVSKMEPHVRMATLKEIVRGGDAADMAATVIELLHEIPLMGITSDQAAEILTGLGVEPLPVIQSLLASKQVEPQDVVVSALEHIEPGALVELIDKEARNTLLDALEVERQQFPPGA